MVNVRAKQRGYAGGAVREQGESFSWPDGVPLGKWVEPVAFAGKGDHDGDGKTGGTADADAGKGDQSAPAEKGKGGRKPKAKPETVQAGEPAEPFADAPPAGEAGKGGGVQDALGGVEPDWVPPGGGAVMADE